MRQFKVAFTPVDNVKNVEETEFRLQAYRDLRRGYLLRVITSVYVYQKDKKKLVTQLAKQLCK